MSLFGELQRRLPFHRRVELRGQTAPGGLLGLPPAPLLSICPLKEPQIYVLRAPRGPNFPCPLQMTRGTLAEWLPGGGGGFHPMFQTITAKAPMRPRVAACREGGPAVAGRPRGCLSSAAQPGCLENTARGSQPCPPRWPKDWVKHGAPPETEAHQCGRLLPCWNSATQHCPHRALHTRPGPTTPQGSLASSSSQTPRGPLSATAFSTTRCCYWSRSGPSCTPRPGSPSPKWGACSTP